VDSSPPDSLPDQRTFDLSARTACILLAVVTFATFLPLCGFEFSSWDDQTYIVNNPRLANPSVENALHFFTNGLFSIYIPLTTTVWMVLSWAGGGAMNPHWFHTTNVLVHLGTTLAAFAVLRKLVPSNIAAMAGAAVVALHPVQVEAVAWVSGLKDVLCGCLTLAAIAVYLTAAERDSKKPLYLAATALFVLALLAKPSAMWTGLIVLMLDRFVLRRPWKVALLWTLPWLIIGAVFAVIARLIQPVIESASTVSIASRPLIVGQAVAFYFGKIVWPAQLAFDYGQNPETVLASPSAKVLWLVPVVVILIALAAWKRSRLPLIGLAIFLIAPLHTLGWVPFDFQRISTTADHYLYVAMLGIGLIVAAYIRRLRRNTAMVLVILLGGLMAAKSFAQVFTWRDPETQLRHVLEVNPRSWAAYNSLAVIALQRGDLPAALTNAEQAIALHPDDPQPYLVKGAVLATRGDLPAATDVFRQAVNRGPGHAGALANLGGILAQQGNLGEARAMLEKALQVDPEQSQALLNLGLIDIQTGQLSQAQSMLQRAVQLDPRNANARLYLADVLVATGQKDAAIAQLHAILEIQPENRDARQRQARLERPAESP